MLTRLIVTLIETPMGEEEIILFPERAVYWPTRQMLMIADLHWGKRFMQLPNQFDLLQRVITEDLAVLSSLSKQVPISRLCILGDFLDISVPLPEDIVSQVADWQQTHGMEWTLVPGNHDRRISDVPKVWRIRRLPSRYTEGPFCFQHYPVDLPDRYTWSGHMHPLYLTGEQSNIQRLPCFYFRKHNGILPAFSHEASGYTISPKQGEIVYVCEADGTLRQIG